MQTQHLRYQPIWRQPWRGLGIYLIVLLTALTLVSGVCPFLPGTDMTFPGSAVAHAGGGLDIQSLRISGERVVIQGSSQPGSKVSLVVISDTTGARKYVDQTAADVSGQFDFAFQLQSGEYRFKMVSDAGGSVEQRLKIGSPGGPGMRYKRVKISVVGDRERGTILPATTLEFPEDEEVTVLDVLERALEEARIDYDSRGGYVSSIGGLSEFDKGPLSGWMYSVNGDFIEIGPADYKVSDGDYVKWVYTLNLGGDIGNRYEGAAENLQDLSQFPFTEERLKAKEKARAEALAALGRMNENADRGHTDEPREASGMPLDQVFENDVVLAPSNVVVTGINDSMPEAEREYYSSLFQTNLVNVEQKVDVKRDVTITDEAEEVCLHIPAGAIPTDPSRQDVTIAVRELSEQEVMEGVTLPASHRLASPVYEFGPDGTSFLTPAILTLSVLLPGGTKPEDVYLAYQESNDPGRFRALPAVLDMANGKISGLCKGFSRFAVLERIRPQIHFNDLDGAFAWAKGKVEYIANIGMIPETGGDFHPERPVTRAEFARLLVTGFPKLFSRGYSASPGTTKNDSQDVFVDAGPEHPLGDYISVIVRTGVMKGYGDGSFRPDDSIQRQEAAAVLARLVMMHQSAKGESPQAKTPPLFSDEAEVDAWAKEGVSLCATIGLMKGSGDGGFLPKKPLSRAEAAVVTYRLLNVRYQ